MTYTFTQNVSKDIFRTYDIRGIVEQELNPDIIYSIARAIGTMTIEAGENTLWIGRDGRLSGPKLLPALSQGLMDSGCDVINLGQITSPILYFACYKCYPTNGVMLTGSHNPTNYNGLKLVIQRNTLASHDITSLYNKICDNTLTNGTGSERQQNLISNYCDYIVSDISLQRPLKIVIDSGNGAAGPIAPGIFERLGCEVIALYCDIDGNFPNHHPDPLVPKNLEDLQKAVLDNHADCGIAFDGDADRLGFVDNKANIIWPDQQMMLFAENILADYPHTNIVYDVKCSQHLGNHITQHGGKAIMWRTGHSILKAKMRDEKAPLAGEMSGHIFFNDDRWFGFDDGIYAGARLLEIIAKQSLDAHTLFSQLTIGIHTPELKIAISDKKKYDFIKKMQQSAQFPNAEICTIDGLRVDYKDGWGLIRCSNTTPSLTVRFEADTNERLQQIQNIFREEIHKIDNQLELPF